MFVLKLISAFIAIATLLLFISSIIKGITNPNIVTDESGRVYDGDRNARAWFGIITSFFWALVIAL